MRDEFLWKRKSSTGVARFRSYFNLWPVTFLYVFIPSDKCWWGMSFCVHADEVLCSMITPEGFCCFCSLSQSHTGCYLEVSRGGALAEDCMLCGGIIWVNHLFYREPPAFEPVMAMVFCIQPIQDWPVLAGQGSHLPLSIYPPHVVGVRCTSLWFKKYKRLVNQCSNKQHMCIYIYIYPRHCSTLLLCLCWPWQKTI